MQIFFQLLRRDSKYILILSFLLCIFVFVAHFLIGPVALTRPFIFAGTIVQIENPAKFLLIPFYTLLGIIAYRVFNARLRDYKSAFIVYVSLFVIGGIYLLFFVSSFYISLWGLTLTINNTCYLLFLILFFPLLCSVLRKGNYWDGFCLAIRRFWLWILFIVGQFLCDMLTSFFVNKILSLIKIQVSSFESLYLLNLINEFIGNLRATLVFVLFTYLFVVWAFAVRKEEPAEKVVPRLPPEAE